MRTNNAHLRHIGLALLAMAACCSFFWANFEETGIHQYRAATVGQASLIEKIQRWVKNRADWLANPSVEILGNGPADGAGPDCPDCSNFCPNFNLTLGDDQAICSGSTTLTAAVAGAGGACSGTTISTFPYSESFENTFGAWVQSTADNMNWSMGSGSTPTSNTGPTGAASGTYYLFIESSSPNNPSKIGMLESPCFDLSNQGGATFGFQYHTYGSSMGTLKLQVSDDNGGTWADLWSTTGDKGNTWFTASVNLDDYAGETIKLRFHNTTGSSYRGDAGIDALSLTVSGYAYLWSTGATTPSISVSPATTTTYSVTVTNAAGCSETDDMNVVVGGPGCVEICNNGTDDDGDGLVDGADPDCSNSCPNFSLTLGDDQAICSGSTTLTAAVAGAGGACSGATISTFPYSESFENTFGAWAQSTADDMDWSMGSGSTPTSNTGPTGAASGTYYLFIESSSPNNPSKIGILESPCFDLSNQGGATFGFQYHTYGSNMGTLKLQVSDDNGGTWADLWSTTGDKGNSWFTASVNLDDYAGETIKLRFHNTTGSSYRGDASIDALSLTVSGYAYSWSTGATTPSIPVSPATTTTYSVTVTNSAGCSETDDINVVVGGPGCGEICGNGTDDDGDGLIDCLDGDCNQSLAVNAGSNATICSGASTTLTASGSGGTTPYTYTWSEGLGTGASKTVSPLSTTIYTVTVTAANGCTATSQVTVTVNALPSANAGPDASVCLGASTTLTASGGASYSWSNGLGTGASKTVSPASTTTYTVTVTAANGCTATDQVIVIVNSCGEICNNGVDDDGDGLIDCADPNCAPTLSVALTDPTCAGGGNNGSINLSLFGGTAPFSFLWSNGATTEDLTGLAAGTYTVTVTTATNCTKTGSYTLKGASGMLVTADVTPTDCGIYPEGAIDLTVSGGTAPYTYLWSNGATTQDLDNLTAGVYGVTVTSTGGCTKTDFITLPNAVSSGYITYYIPMPEEQIRTTLKRFTDYMNKSISSQIKTIISIVPTENNTLIYYDHWEDGYEADILNPTQNSTEIWGDNNASNGKPPGFATDVVNAGNVISCVNLVNTPRNPNQKLYDGRDKITSSDQVALSRAAWAPTPGPVLSSAIEVMDTKAYGKNFIVPIGQNTPSNSMFEYTALVVMANENLTQVNFDTDGNGATDLTKLLNQGESYLMDGGVNAGCKITSTRPVQAHLMTGDLGGYYETRWFTLFPTELWDNNYYTPVGTTSNADPVYIFVYNPKSSSISVNYKTLSSAGSFTVPAKGTYKYVMPSNSGARFYTNVESDKFFAVCTIDSDPDDHDAYDWSFSLMPETYLTTSATVGWGPGNENLSANGSPVWVTAISPTDVYVDYDGDLTTGPLTDAQGNKYNVKYTLQALESKRVFDNTDNDQTGMYLYTLDGTLIATAWGEDPATAAPGNPFLDLGTIVPPVRRINAWKTYALTTDNNGNGQVDQGDVVTFSVHLKNAGNSPIYEIRLTDNLPTGVAYVPNSTQFNGSTVADNTTGTPFPADELGYFIAQLPVNTTYILSFRTQVNLPPPVLPQIVNSFTALVGLPCKTLTGSVTIPISQPVTVNCSVGFTDAGGSGISLFQENSQVCVTVTDADQNKNSGVAETITATVENQTSGDREYLTLTETGANTGIFRGCIQSSSAGGQVTEDGTLFAQSGNVLSATHTDLVYGETCTTVASVTAPSQVKFLYLTDPAQGLDRIDPVATADATTASVFLGSSGGSGNVTLDAVEDTWIKADQPTLNYGSSTEIKVDRESTKLERALVLFDVSAIPAGATITSATLTLTKTAGSSSINVAVHQINTAWDEGTGALGGTVGTANWNQRSSGTAWTAAGGDYGAAVSTVNIAGNGAYDWDVASIVQSWVNGTANNGFLLESPDGGGDRSQTFGSREHGTAASRPKLTVAYTY